MYMYNQHFEKYSTSVVFFKLSIGVNQSIFMNPEKKNFFSENQFFICFVLWVYCVYPLGFVFGLMRYIEEIDLFIIMIYTQQETVFSNDVR